MKWSKDDMLSVLESLLLCSDKPLKIADFLSCMTESLTAEKVINHLEILAKKYQNKDRGIQLRKVAGGFQLVTKDENKAFVQRLKKAQPFRLSKVSLEVLAIIAYQQPCTRAEISQIRRVDSGHIVRVLLERNLITFAGQSDQPGRPMMYKTTKRFLEVYGLDNLKSLPSLEEIKNEFNPQDGASKVQFNLDAVSESIDMHSPNKPTL